MNSPLDQIAQTYHLNPDVPDKFIETLCQEYCCNWIDSLITAHDSVLELGVGDGVTLERLHMRARRYCVLEGSQQLVTAATEKYPGVEIVHGMFEDFAPAQAFSKVLALHVLEHVDKPLILLEKMRNWLTKTGELIIAVPNARSIHRQLAVMMGLQPALDTLSPRDHMVGHQRVYTLDELKAQMLCAGYQLVEEKGFFLKAVPNSMMLAWRPELIAALNTVSEQLPPDLLANIAIRARLPR